MAHQTAELQASVDRSFGAKIANCRLSNLLKEKAGPAQQNATLVAGTLLLGRLASCWVPQATTSNGVTLAVRLCASADAAVGLLDTTLL